MTEMRRLPRYRRTAFLAVVLVAVVVLFGATRVGADDLPPPPGWTQEQWDRLSPDDQQIERENAPATIDDAAAEIAAEQAWADAHQSEEELDAELFAVLPLQADEFESPALGIGPAPQRYDRDLYGFWNSWIGMSDDAAQMIEVDAGWLVAAPTTGVLIVNVYAWPGDDGDLPPPLSEDVYTYENVGALNIESSQGDVLTLSRWTDGTLQPGTVLFDVSDRTFNSGSGSTLYLHGSGGTANPPTLTLDAVEPSSATDKYSDSQSVKFSGGNAWRDVGTWSAAPAASQRTIAALGDLHVWLGLKNSDDQGTQFDLRAQVYLNGAVVASGLTRCVTGITRNQAQAKEVTVSFPSLSSTTVAASDVVALTLSTRIGTNPDDTKCAGHSNAVGLRVYYDSTARPARFSEAQ